MFLDRSRRAGPLLEWKVRIFVVGAVVGLAGIYLEDRRITGVAILVLVAGVLLRFLPGGPHESPEDLDEPSPEEGAEGERDGGGPG